VQTVLEVDLAVPLDRVREQVAVEGGFVGKDRIQLQLTFGGDQLVEADRAGATLAQSRDERP
jgi:hypothetical protein